MLSTILYSALAITPAAAHVVGRGCGGHDMHVGRDVMDYHNAQMSKRQSAGAPTDVASLKALGNGMSLVLMIWCRGGRHRRGSKGEGREREVCARKLGFARVGGGAAWGRFRLAGRQLSAIR
jgi:hypothetical protein